MEIGQEEVGRAIVITPIGHLDSKTSPEFEALLVDLLSQGHKRYLIEFSAVETISSAALRVLLMFTRKLRTSGGSLALSSLNSHVRQVFDISGFTASFTISDSRRPALASLDSGAGQAAETARRAARILGVKASPMPGRDLGVEADPTTATGSLALHLLRQAGPKAASGHESHGARPAAVVEAPADDPVLEASGGAGASRGPAIPAASELWRRLRRRLDS